MWALAGETLNFGGSAEEGAIGFRVQGLGFLGFLGFRGLGVIGFRI